MVSNDPNDPSFGLETDVQSPNFGLSQEEPSGLQQVGETLQKGLEIGQKAYMASLMPGVALNKALFPEQAKLVESPLIPSKVITPVVKALQAPQRTLLETAFGDRGKRLSEFSGEFLGEQLAGFTSPESLALLAVPGAIGKMPKLREIAFGKPPTAPPEIPAEYQERRFTMVPEEKPTYEKPVEPIEQAVEQVPIPEMRVSPETGFEFPVEPEVRTNVPSETARLGGETNATQEGQIPESNIPEYPGDGESRPPAETSSSSGYAEGGETKTPIEPSVPQPEQIPVEETPVLEVPQEAAPVPEAVAPTTAEPLPQEIEGGARAETLEQRPIETPEPGEAIGWQEAVQHGENWLNKGGDINKVVTDFRRTGKVNSWEMGKMRAYLQRLQAVTNKAGDDLRANPSDPVLQQQYGAALTREQLFSDAYKPMHTVASNSLRSLQGPVPLTDEMAASYTGLTRRFGEFRGREMTPEEAVKAERLSKQANGSNGEYARANEELYRMADTEYGRIRTTRKGPPSLEDIGKTFGQTLKEVCEV